MLGVRRNEGDATIGDLNVYSIADAEAGFFEPIASEADERNGRRWRPVTRVNVVVAGLTLSCRELGGVERGMVIYGQLLRMPSLVSDTSSMKVLELGGAEKVRQAPKVEVAKYITTTYEADESRFELSRRLDLLVTFIRDANPHYLHVAGYGFVR